MSALDDDTVSVNRDLLEIICRKLDTAEETSRFVAYLATAITFEDATEEIRKRIEDHLESVQSSADELTGNLRFLVLVLDEIMRGHPITVGGVS